MQISASENKGSLPLFIRFSVISVGILAFVILVTYLQSILLPFAFATIIAILLNPLVNFFARRKISRTVSICLSVLVAMLMTFLVFYFVASQIIELAGAAPQWQDRVQLGVETIVDWVAATFGVGESVVRSWINERINDTANISSVFIGETVYTVSHLLIVVFLIPVYIFLILYYKPILLRFLAQIFSKKEHVHVVDALTQIRSLVQSYLSGLMIEAAVMTVLNAVTFVIIGLDYALLIGLINALLNVIPYIGGIAGLVLTMLFALITESPYTALLVLVAHVLVIFIDINFINPKIVGGKVKLNALTSIIAVLIGGELCGAPGMFLSIPAIAIFKVICDRVERLKAIGALLGDTMPPIGFKLFEQPVPVVTTEEEIKRESNE